ncbi:hypothetical protein HDU92_006312 [Lobulomyces angularis]|nr:hypothetical protein HDU92_006312 [Lobulomyces angularis]
MSKIIQVEVTDDIFTPATVNILAGDTVQWNFRSFHNVYETVDSSCTVKNTWNSADLSTGTYTQTFANNGTFYYACTVGNHCQMGMKGVVNVGALSSATANNSPATTTSTTTTSTSKSNGSRFVVLIYK